MPGLLAPFLMGCPVDICSLLTGIFPSHAARDEGDQLHPAVMLQYSCWLGLPCVPALSFDQQRWDYAIAVVLGSACHVSLWSEIPCLSRVWLSLTKRAEPLFTGAAVG